MENEAVKIKERNNMQIGKGQPSKKNDRKTTTNLNWHPLYLLIYLLKKRIETTSIRKSTKKNKNPKKTNLEKKSYDN